jgi:hypothetical protein
MTRKVSDLEAERLSETPMAPQDAAFLKRYYDQQIFCLGKSALIKSSALPPLSDAEILEQLRPMMSMVRTKYPDFPDIPDARVVANYREHENASSGMLGDYSRKLKKWTLYVLSDYASILAKNVFLAALCLDQLNACTMKLPSGAVAIIVNDPLLGITPVLYSAFLEIYEAGTATEGAFTVDQSDSTRLILEMARIFASKDFGSLPSAENSVRLRLDACEMSLQMPLLAALHECAHVLLGHLSVANEVERRVNEIDADSWRFAQALELKADAFAVNQLLNLDDAQRLVAFGVGDARRWAFHVAFACTVFFGFGHLVSECSIALGVTHPHFAHRWASIRGQLVDAVGEEIVIKRLEGIIQSLAVMRQFETKE